MNHFPLGSSAFRLDHYFYVDARSPTHRAFALESGDLDIALIQETIELQKLKGGNAWRDEIVNVVTMNQTHA